MDSLRDFLNELENKYPVLEVDQETSLEYQVAKILRSNPHEIIIFKNIAENDKRIISGICNSREKIARSLNVEVPEISSRIIEAMENPLPIETMEKTSQNFQVSKKADLKEIPIPTYYRKDAGPYITAGVIIAKNPETGIRNASIHRMLVTGGNRMGVRIVPRNLYTYHQIAEKQDQPLEVAIAIGMHPATLLASCTSIPITADELEVANQFHQGQMKLIKCDTVDLEVPDCEILLEGKILPHVREEEGPFVDLTDTYDVVRKEPVIELTKMHYKEDPMFHAIMPAGLEHKLLQGLPQEPRIFNIVRNTVPTVKNVVLTEGGCCWLHAAVSIQKQTQGDGKNVLMAALTAHPSLKHCVVVDDDIDIFKRDDIEYAIATRVKGDDDVLIIPGARGSSLDPTATPDGTTTKIGVDATKPLDKLDKFIRVSQSE
ncbi:MAG TPA: UbiD family decarboxylase [Methanobacterium sp.]|nr:UbiD family decarboxylase [Methanobacterium sp.]